MARIRYTGWRCVVVIGPAVALLVSAAVVGHAQAIDTSRGSDPRVDYRALVDFGPWDDRNYGLSLEDLQWLAPNEAELEVSIPAFFRVEMRKANPRMPRTGPAQYPRSAPEIFRQVRGGLLVNGLFVSSPSTAAPDVSVNSEVLIEPGAESAIAVSPTDADRVIAGFNSGSPSHQRMVYSTDGGATWSLAADLPNSCCDPTVAWSADGTVAFTATMANCTGGGCGISAYRSTDGGQTWIGGVDLTSSGSDKEYLHVDASPSSPFKDSVYLTWHENTILQFARSTDMGLTWSSPLSFDSDPLGIGSDITTDSAGRVFYLWPATNNRQIMLKISTDGGTTFAPATSVATTNGAYDFPIPAMETRNAWIYTVADVDFSSGPFADSVYVAWTDTTGPEGATATDNHTAIKVAFSRDHGASWTIVTPHSTADSIGVDRFNQWLRVDAQGAVHLVYYTTEYVAPDRASVDLAYQVSLDGGVTWSDPTRVTSASSPNIVDSFEFGDYNGIDVSAAGVAPIWTDNRSETTGDSVDIYVADVANISSEPDFYLAADNLEQSVCTPGSLVDIPIQVGVYQMFANPVTLAYQGLSSGFSGSILGSPVSPPGQATAQLGVAGGTAPGLHQFGIAGTATGSLGHALAVSVEVYGATAGQPTLLSPADGATSQPVGSPFSWSPVAGAATYDLQVATDDAFSSLVIDETGAVNPQFVPLADLTTNTRFFWRVRTVNPCGAGAWSVTFDFVTEAVPGECPLGTVPVNHFFDDMEAGATGWTHGGAGDTWALSGARVSSGSSAFLGIDSATPSDQRLESPAVALPADAQNVTLQFETWQEIQEVVGECGDGALLEISTNDGGTWAQVTAGLATDPYDGPVSSSRDNPLKGLDAWCGDPQDWLRSVVDLGPWAGETVRFRFRLGTDTSMGREGWYIDDVKVQSCLASTVFKDGFESGLTDAWSYTAP